MDISDDEDEDEEVDIVDDTSELSDKEEEENDNDISKPTCAFSKNHSNLNETSKMEGTSRTSSFEIYVDYENECVVPDNISYFPAYGYCYCV